MLQSVKALGVGALNSRELLQQVLSLISGELFLVGADGVSTPLEPDGAASQQSGQPAPRFSMQEACRRAPAARAQLERLLGGSAEQVAFSLELDHQPYEVRVRALRGAQGEFLAGIGLARPAQERAELERALQASESRLRQIFDSNMIGMMFWGANPMSARKPKLITKYPL